MRKAIRGLVRRDRNQSAVALEPQIASPQVIGDERATETETIGPPTEAPSATTTEAQDDCGTADSEDLWSREYRSLAERESGLVQDYEKHIDARQDAAAASATGASRLTALSSPDSVKDLVRALQKSREETQWTFSVRSKDHKVRDQLEKLVKFLTLADGVVKQALSTQPYAALAWSVVSVFLPLLSGSYKIDTAIVQGFTIIGELQAYWKSYEEVYLQSTSSEQYKNLVIPLSNVYSYMLEYQVRAVCHLSKKQLSRAWQKVAGERDWITKKDYVIEVSNRCAAYITPLQNSQIMQNVALHTEKLERICDAEEGILQAMRDQKQKGVESSLLQALRSAAGDYKYGKEFNPDPVKGTCEWFFGDGTFSTWRTSAGSGVFWLTAGPGCGKSVLARTLINDGHLKSTATTVNIGSSATVTSSMATICYFFFKDEGAQRTTTTAAFCALLHQLFSCESTKNLIDHAIPAYERTGKALTHSFDDLWDTLIKCVVNLTGKDVVCVLDALDECNSQDRERLISKLNRFYENDQFSAKTNLKFLITSRPYDDIERLFRSFSKRDTYFQFDADERHKEISHDIGLVIDAKMKSFASDYDDEDCQKIGETLRAKGTNTYLWLSLTLGIIDQHPNRYSRRRDVEALLSEIPTGTSDAYEKTLNKSKDARATITLLQILVAATEPLAVEEANYALTLALEDPAFETHAELDRERWKGDFKTVVKNLCGLIVNVYDGKLSFIHLTAKEYLLDDAGPNSPATKWRGCLADAAVLHETISRCCIQYLLLSDFTSRTVPLLETEKVRYPLLRYASVNWPFHFEAQNETLRCLALPKARILCSTSSNPLRIWGPIYLRRSGGGLPSWIFTFIGWKELAIASFLGASTLVNELLRDESIDVDEYNEECGSALQAAIAVKNEAIVALLITGNANVNAHRGTPLEFAALYHQHLGITQLLLSNGASPRENISRGRKFQLELVAKTESKEIFYALVASILPIDTPEAIMSAIANDAITSCGDKCVALLLDLLPSEMLRDVEFLTPETFRIMMAVDSVGEKALQLIVKQKRQHILLERSIFPLALRLQGIGQIFRDLLREDAKACTMITRAMLEDIAVTGSAETMVVFLEHCPEGVCEAKDLLPAAMRNSSMFKLIIELAGENAVTDEIFQSGGRPMFHATMEIVHIFFKLPRFSAFVARQLVELTVKLFKNNSLFGELDCQDIVISILNRCSHDSIVDNSLMEHAATCKDRKTIQILMRHYHDDYAPGRATLVNIASGSQHAWLIIEFLIQKYGPEAIIAPAVVSAAARHNNNVLKFLLERYTSAVVVTEWLLASECCETGLEILIKWKRDEVAAAAPAALRRAVPIRYYSRSRVLRLINCCPMYWFGTAEDLLVDLCEGSGPLYESDMASLIDRLGESIVINDRTLEAMASNGEYGADWLEMIKKWKPDEFKVTPGMVKAAAAAGGCRTLDYMSKESDGALEIDHECYRLAKWREVLRKGSLTDLKELWNKGAFPDIADVHGKTALHMVATREPMFAKFLLDVASPDVDAVDRRGWTPLHHAVQPGLYIATVQVLIDAGADPNMTSFDGQSPITLVEEIMTAQGHSDFVLSDYMLSILKGTKRIEYIVAAT